MSIRLQSRFFVAMVLGVMIWTVSAIPPASADEGMWLPHLLDNAPVESWQERGLSLNARELYDPKGTDVTDAVVKVGGGTGTFVSSEGLIVTNHHVAAGALQRASTVEDNYLEDGVLVAKRTDEIPALGYDAYVLLDARDVTKDVMKHVADDMTPAERSRAIELAEKQIVEATEAGGDVHAEVSSVYGGAQFYLYTYFKIKDLRIVYAPPRSIGVYGGDIDNWMWPRHTGDFAFLRAYVARDGKSADYHEDNVPYRPRNFLAFSVDPFADGDFTMVIGYPGRTMRHRSSYAIDHSVNVYYPGAIQRYEDLLAILEDEAARDEDAKIKLASSIQSLNNSYKNNQGMLEGMTQYHLLEMKQAEEQRLREFMAAKEEMGQAYGQLFDELETAVDEYNEASRTNEQLRWMLYLSNALRSAYTIYNWGVEQSKSEADRDASYMPRDEDRLRRRLELADRRYFEPADKRIMGYFLRRLAGSPTSEKLEGVLKSITTTSTSMGGDNVDRAIAEFIDGLYAGTTVTDAEARLEMFGKDADALDAAKDPMIEFAAGIEAEMERFETVSHTYTGRIQRLRPQLIALRQAAAGGTIYPDANRTMRVSTGKIQGYTPRDAVHYGSLTSLGGVLEKHTGDEPFDCPEKLAALYREQDFGIYADPTLKDVPVNFLTTDDITGGNSGSAVLNGRGQIIGLAFDGNYESISSDYQFLPDLTRCIAVDSRYILFVMEKFSGASELLAELTVEQHASR